MSLVNSNQCRSRTVPWLILRDKPFVVSLLLLSLSIKLFLLRYVSVSPAVSESTHGLLALQTLYDTAPLFLNNNIYIGTAPFFLSGLLFQFFEPSYQVLEALSLTLSLLTLLGCYLIGNFLGGKPVARLSGLLVGVSPLAFQLDSIHMAEGVVFFTALLSWAVLLTFYWNFSLNRPIWLAFVIGLLYGVLTWTATVGIGLSLITLAYLWFCSARFPAQMGYSRRIDLIATVVSFSGAWLFGALRLIRHNVHHYWVHVARLPDLSPSEILANLQNYLTDTLPVMVGAKLPLSSDALFPWLSIMLLILYLPLFVLIAQNLFQPVRRHFEGEPEDSARIHQQLAGIYLFVLIVTYSLVTASGLFGYSRESGYLSTPVTPLLCCVLACVMFKAQRLRPSLRYIPMLVLGLNVSLLVFGSLKLFEHRSRSGVSFGNEFEYGTRTLNLGACLTSNNLQVSVLKKIIALLQKNGITWIRADYCLGTSLSFLSREEIRYLPLSESPSLSMENYTAPVEWTDTLRVPILVSQEDAPSVHRVLSDLGYVSKIKTILNWKILDDISPRGLHRFPNLNSIHVPTLESFVSSNEANLRNLFDRDYRSSWSPINFETDTIITLVQSDPPIQGLKIYWQSLALRPSFLEIRSKKADKEEELLSGNAFRTAMRYFPLERSLSLYFVEDPRAEITVLIPGQQSGQVWSLAEIEVIGGAS